MKEASPPASAPLSGEPDGFSLPKRARVHTGREIRRVMRRGKRVKTDYLDVFVDASPVSFPRLGLVVPKHRRTIVERNRVKRRIREVGRTELLPRLRNAGASLDVVIRARPQAYDASFAELKNELTDWVERELCASS